MCPHEWVYSTLFFCYALVLPGRVLGHLGQECAAIHCGDGGLTWAMALVLADWLTTRLPEYPRLRLLELGAGTGLVASSLQKRGHEVVITDGKDEAKWCIPGPQGHWYFYSYIFVDI